MKKILVLIALVMTTGQMARADHGEIGGAIAGGIIGGVLGGVIAAGAQPEYYPRYPQYPDYGDYPESQVVCYARNYRGMTFRAVGFDERHVQYRAMARCASVSRYCQPVGCEYYEY